MCGFSFEVKNMKLGATYYNDDAFVFRILSSFFHVSIVLRLMTIGQALSYQRNISNTFDSLGMLICPNQK